MRLQPAHALVLVLSLVAACSDLGAPYEYRAECDRAPGGIDFGRVSLGQFKERTVVIANSGNTDLVGDVSLSDTHFIIVSGAGPFSLPPDSEIKVVLRCAPADTGLHRAEVELGDGCGPVYLAGIGVPPPEGPQCVVDPPTLAFDPLKIDEVAERTVEIRNVGLIDFNIDVGLDVAGPFEIVSGAGFANLDPGDTVRVAIRFAPASPGDYTANLVVGSTCDALAVSGTGKPPFTVSYSLQVQPIFNSRCVSCHGGAIQNGGLDLRAANSYDNIVDVVSSGYAPDKRVVPGDPVASVLFGKVMNTGDYGQRMPPAGAALSVANQQTIETWIQEGANRN